MRREKRRALGQHFLKSRRTLQKILSAIDAQPDELIIEIGAGRGVLTFPLAAKAGRVIAIEKDSRLLPHLNRPDIKNLSVLAEDVLSVDFRDLGKPDRTKIVGNLPYSLSTPILSKVDRERDVVGSCFFLLQKEVAQRVCGRPGSKDYSPLSIILGNHFQLRVLFSIGPEAFSPPPRVESALISMIKRRRSQVADTDEGRFLEFLQTCFRHRRKTLLNNLKKGGYDEDEVRQALQECSLSPRIRAEQVPLEPFAVLYSGLSHRN